MTSTLELPKTAGYRSAVRAYNAARRLTFIATLFAWLGALLGAGAITGCVVVIFRAHTDAGRWIATGSLFGAFFWVLGVMLAATWAQAYARDVIARQPWEPK